ncbi:MAG: hypothetical protein QMC81_09675 [Thermoanaerobacterales bacterium]|nr:hypothetical protein [Thermoanaerobacterales bacterium]
MQEGKVEKKVRVHRLVRKRTLQPGEEERRPRAAPVPSWACARTATRWREDKQQRLPRPVSRATAARTRPPLRQRSPMDLVGLAGGLIALAGSLVRRLQPGRRRGAVLAVLGAAVAAFTGGMVLEFTVGPTAPALDYIGGFATAVQGWFSPATRTALAAGGLLVAIGLWLVIQVLKTAPDERAVATPRNTYIPREMYERHA